jgi:hypothetical protein
MNIRQNTMEEFTARRLVWEFNTLQDKLCNKVGRKVDVAKTPKNQFIFSHTIFFK